MTLRGLLDSAVAAAGLVVLSPLLLLVAAAIVFEDGFPVLFRQERIGLNGLAFVLLKFRSMRASGGGARITSAQDGRITSVGRLLRKYKIDELPQLWNVCIGEMRLVGPRPEIAPFVELDDAVWREVLSVPPGITDPASLLFRNEEHLLAGAEDVEAFYRKHILPGKLALNVEYLRRRSLWRDLHLIALTVWYSLFPHRVNAERIRRDFFPGAAFE